jgi:hypothetical protein
MTSAGFIDLLACSLRGCAIFKHFVTRNALSGRFQWTVLRLHAVLLSFVLENARQKEMRKRKEVAQNKWDPRTNKDVFLPVTRSISRS